MANLHTGTYHDPMNWDVSKPRNCCKSFGCNCIVSPFQDFCNRCLAEYINTIPNEEPLKPFVKEDKYSAYFKDVSKLDRLDVYGVHQLFNLNDPSGALQHASKKLLLSGVRTGGKSKYKDIQEARDSLNRWLELNPEPASVG